MTANRITPPHRCRWVCRRLPLLAGGDLAGSDRRKVERHLIVCPDCREHEASLADALGVLQAVAFGAHFDPGPSTAQALWPALERQIVEARHAPPASLFERAVAWLDGLVEPLRDGTWSRSLRLVSAPTLVLSLSLVAVAGGVALGARRLADSSLATDRVLRSPLARRSTRSALDPPPLVLPIPVEPASTFDSGGSAVAHFHFDLDHGTPMGPDSRDSTVKPSY